MDRVFRIAIAIPLLVATVFGLTGCTSMRDYVHNGFKVGPEVGPCRPPMPNSWIDSADSRLRPESPDLSQWWTVFNDPVLDGLVADAYRQNLSLKEAGFRVLEARAQLGIVTGQLFPQTQAATGGYARQATSHATNSASSSPQFFSQWNLGFTLSWELDFWGRFRRAVEAADNKYFASIEDYDNVLVTLLGDVATNYVQVRVAQQQVELAKANARLQRSVLNIIEARLRAGRIGELDVDQAEASLAQVEAQIPLFETITRQAENRLCILLGMPPVDLEQRLGTAPIPMAPPEAVVGVPAELLVRRPDVRQAQFEAAAQAEAIGIAQAEFYPHVAINGTLGYAAKDFSDLFTSAALNSSVGPSFQWNILNYGRLVNAVRYQDARFNELLLRYQNTVYRAAEEVENGIVTFLRSQKRAQMLDRSATASEKAVNIVVNQYRIGTVDFNRVVLIEQNLVVQQDLLAQARGQIAIGLVNVYRALGGGWQIRLPTIDRAGLTPPPHSPEAPEMIRTPAIFEPTDTRTPKPEPRAP